MLHEVWKPLYSSKIGDILPIYWGKQAEKKVSADRYLLNVEYARD